MKRCSFRFLLSTVPEVVPYHVNVLVLMLEFRVRLVLRHMLGAG